MLTRVYRNGVLEVEGFDPAQVSDYLDEPDTVVWLDVCRPTPADLDVVAEELGLHPLARADATGRPQRPKLEPYAGHQFLVAYAAAYDEQWRRLSTAEIDVFFSSRWLLTVRKEPVFPIEQVLERWDGAPDLAKHGVGFLLHGLLDVVVDTHFAAVELLDNEVEEIEDQLFDPATAGRPENQLRMYELRKALVALRRVTLPMREVVHGIMVRDVVRVDGELRPYFQDVYDHVLRAGEWTDSLRDLVTSATEAYLTLQGNRLNEIMKRLTSWAAIIAVPTAIAGVYGMNFRLVPADGSLFGFWFALSLIGLSSVALFFYFRRRDWL